MSKRILIGLLFFIAGSACALMRPYQLHDAPRCNYNGENSGRSNMPDCGYKAFFHDPASLIEHARINLLEALAMDDTVIINANMRRAQRCGPGTAGINVQEYASLILLQSNLDMRGGSMCIITDGDVDKK